MTSNTTEATLEFSAVRVLLPREQVENQLRKAILDGSLTEGGRLPSEHALASAFNVSRATVREALRSLVEGGFLGKGQGMTSGLYVQSVDHNALSRIISERLSNILGLGSVTADEVSTFRDLLEVPSARLAAEYRLKEHLKALHAIIDQEAATTHDHPLVPELNARFHIEVANASGNRVLAAFVSALHRAAQPLAFIRTDEKLGRVAVTHHIQLYRAIADKDTTAAETAMRKHLEMLRLHAAASGAAGMTPV
ncbi:FadR/GntR family transcriptional regulator [Arthrobacter sp. FW306-2-2C-D06B]|uniref:FadR/GntR family transcriptional regulator n=1 Tax=Arthrobacter sp. FW306-2-2C-D06B TaxID=2879618 RepID=UPI001F1CC363|nr:FCD domain-containing protein [Arthrobacter sp. FW306-2-2C-D06B]UKA60449.1 FCD domain-containing protein [Arthrobacter sp. FW306-2-2C-D06B]